MPFDFAFFSDDGMEYNGKDSCLLSLFYMVLDDFLFQVILYYSNLSLQVEKRIT